MPPAKFLRMLAKDDVRRKVLETPDERVFIVSLRLMLGRADVGDGGRERPADDVREERRERYPPSGFVSSSRGELLRDVLSRRVKGDSSRRAVI